MPRYRGQIYNIVLQVLDAERDLTGCSSEEDAILQSVVEAVNDEASDVYVIEAEIKKEKV